MSGYTKLFNSILASTVWRTDHTTRIVWITMLAMADKRGQVDASIPGLADFARVTLAECEAALATLAAPDRYSRTQILEGRRIQERDGGWCIVNHGKFRAALNADERREYLRTKQAEYRRKQKSTNVNNVSYNSTLLTYPSPAPDPDPEAKEHVQPPLASLARVKDDSFDAFWDAYPNKSGKQDALKVWRHLKPDGPLQARILATIARQRHEPSWLKERGQFIPGPGKWLRHGKWDDEPVTLRADVPRWTEADYPTARFGGVACYHVPACASLREHVDKDHPT